MNNIRVQSLLAALLMVAASVFALDLAPKENLAAANKPTIDLKAMVPEAFDGWRNDETEALAQVTSPELQIALNRLYSQILSRTYVNDAGDRVMLMIAYGGTQTDSMQVHLPDYCYPAQGFSLSGRDVVSLPIGSGALRVTRMVAEKGERIEPLMYWLVVGRKMAAGEFGRKWTRLKYGLTGEIPDGMLVRVSTLDSDSAHAFDVQEQFVRQMIESLSPGDRQTLSGIEG